MTQIYRLIPELPTSERTELVITDIGGTLVREEDYKRGIKEIGKELFKPGFEGTNLGLLGKLRKLYDIAMLKLRFDHYDVQDRIQRLAKLAENFTTQTVEYVGSLWAENLNENAMRVLERYKSVNPSFAVLSMEAEQAVGPIFHELERRGYKVDKYIVNRLIEEDGIIVKGLESSSNIPGHDINEPMDTKEKKLEGYIRMVESYGFDPYDRKDLAKVDYLTDDDDAIEGGVKTHTRKYGGKFYVV
jgi:hypothetical protein